MNMMHYNNYYGSIEYSEEDEIMYGKILFISDLVSYEGETVAQLKKRFEESVEHYVEACKAAGHEPNKTCKGSLNVRIGPDLHFRANIEAAKKGISLNKFITQAVESRLPAQH